MNDLETIKSMLSVCVLKKWTEVVRLLDQSEVMGTPWGSACTLQVMDYGTGEWIPCAVGEKTTYSMAHLYRFIRSELAYDGRVLVAVAA